MRSQTCRRRERDGTSTRTGSASSLGSARAAAPCCARSSSRRSSAARAPGISSIALGSATLITGPAARGRGYGKRPQRTIANRAISASLGPIFLPSE